MSNKFKPGDRVRRTGFDNANMQVGDTGEVVDHSLVLGSDDFYIVKCNGRTESHNDRYLELVSRNDTTPINTPAKRLTTLPTDSNARKDIPMHRGCLRYFPAALAGVANTSKLGNDKHNPNEEMHHARNKSTDQTDCILRHLMDVEDLVAALERGDTTVTPDAILTEVNQLAWRALAFSQELHEKFGAPLAPGAKVTGSKK